MPDAAADGSDSEATARASRSAPARRRIAIIKLGALGDVILATGAIRAICQQHAGDHCALLTTPGFADLFSQWPGLAVTAIPRHGASNLWRMLGFLRSGFDRIYDLQSNDRTALLCAFSGVAERAGNHTRFPYNLHPAQPWRGQCHIFERMNAVLAAAGLAPAPARAWLPAGAAEQARVQAWLAAERLAGRPFALVHAGASPDRPEKRWPGFPELTARLTATGLAVVAAGAGPDRAVNAALAARGAADATDRFSIPELACLAAHARFALTNDSGPMHAIAVAGIPVYAFFGPSDWRRNHALGHAERVLAAPDLAAIEPATVMRRLTQDGLLAPSSAA